MKSKKCREGHEEELVAHVARAYFGHSKAAVASHRICSVVNMKCSKAKAVADCE